MSSSLKSRLVSLIRLPWGIEIVATFLVVFQENFRLESRTGHQTLPVSATFQSFYYYHFGDFFNGFIDAFVIDGLTDTLLMPFIDKRLRHSPRLLSPPIRAIVASVISALIVVVFETRQNAITQSDLSDIPAGVAGALGYLLVRLIALQVRSRTKPS